MMNRGNYYVVLQRQSKVLKIKLDCQVLVVLQTMMVLNFGVDWISGIPACSDETFDHEYRLCRIPVPLSCVFISYAMAV
jgi:ABC-type cobalamin transport system permease subunit